MPYLNESEMLRKIKLRRFLREFAGGNQKKFADLTGLQQSQVSQLVGDRREVTDKMWIKILGSLNVPDTALPEDYDMLQQELEVSKKSVHQGRQLEEYMRKHNIKNIDVAKILGVSPPMVSIYKSSEQFRPDVAEKINKFLTVNEDPVLYGASSGTPDSLPLISDSVRNLTDLSKCPRYEIVQKTEYDLKDAVVIKVDTDFMEPVFKKDSELLAIAVPSAKYKYHTGLTAIHYADMVAIGEVMSNDLLDKGFITLQRGKGAVLRVLGEDIQHLWHIALGLNVKF